MHPDIHRAMHNKKGQEARLSTGLVRRGMDLLWVRVIHAGMLPLTFDLNE